MLQRRPPLEPFQKPLLGDARLPRWLPDETLHSWLCRYHQVSGGSSREITCRRLFGIARWRSRHDFPFHLTALHERSGGLLGPARSLALDRTIVKMFLPFVSTERAAAVLKAMAVPEVGSVAAKIGLLRSGVSGGHPLKACPRCLMDDLKNYHTPYWHRIHQCPGVWVCLIHHCELLVANDEDSTPWEWYLPSEGKLKRALNDETMHADNVQRLAQLASFADGVLTLPADVHLDPVILRRIVFEQLRSRDLATERVVRLRALAALYIRTWDLVVKEPSLLPFRTDLPALCRWLGKLLDRDFTGCHPLAWLTVIGLFFDSWNAFMAAYARVAADPRRQTIATTTSTDNSTKKQRNLPVRLRSGNGRGTLDHELQETHRTELERRRAMYPHLSRALLRLRCQAAYSWLLRNDREWLEARLPPSKDRRGTKFKDSVAGTAEPQLSWSF